MMKSSTAPGSVVSAGAVVDAQVHMGAGSGLVLMKGMSFTLGQIALCSLLALPSSPAPRCLPVPRILCLLFYRRPGRSHRCVWKNFPEDLERDTVRLSHLSL